MKKSVEIRFPVWIQISSQVAASQHQAWLLLSRRWLHHSLSASQAIHLKSTNLPLGAVLHSKRHQYVLVLRKLWWTCLNCLGATKPQFVITNEFIGWQCICEVCGRFVLNRKYLDVDDQMPRESWSQLDREQSLSNRARVRLISVFQASNVALKFDGLRQSALSGIIQATSRGVEGLALRRSANRPTGTVAIPGLMEGNCSFAQIAMKKRRMYRLRPVS